MKKTNKRTKKSYSPEFKADAIKLANEIGAKQAAEKLGIGAVQTISSWVRYSKKMEEDEEFQEIELLKAENKRLKKQAEKDKKVIAILKDATAFFCQDSQK